MVSLWVEYSALILVGFQGVVGRCRFLWFDTVEYFINLQWRRNLKRKWRFGGSLNKTYPYGAKEWNVNWINKTGGEKKISGILKATSNGLRQQSVARRAVIKVSCSSNIVQVWCFVQH